MILSSLVSPPSNSTCKTHLTNSRIKTKDNPINFVQIGFLNTKLPSSSNTRLSSSSSSSWSGNFPLVQVLPLAASLAILLWTNPAKAGFLSGFSGIESIPGPKLPEVEFLNRFNEENQKKYAEFDERFKSSPLLKKLLEKSKQNKEKNKQAILDKYCLRGAEWGVGDCSADGMSPEDRENFIAMLKKKAVGTE